MARSLSQMLLAGGAQGGQNALTQVQQGVRTGMELASIQQQIESQKAQATAQRVQAENAKLTFMQKGFNNIVTAGSDGAAKRKAKLFQKSAATAGILFSEDFLADAVERRDQLQFINKGLGELVTNPDLSPEDRSKILGESFQIISEEGGFTKAFTSMQQIAQSQAKQRAQKETQEAQREVREEKVTQQTFSNISKLRKERQVDATTKDTRAIQASFGKIQDAAKGKSSAAGDLSLIFNLMKMFDPGSTVREGEFATAQNSAGVPDRVRNLFNNLIRGERLNPAQRKDFAGTAQGILLQQLERQESQDTEFTNIAEQNELPISQLGIRDEDTRAGAIKKFGLKEAVVTPLAGGTAAPALDLEAFIESKKLSPEKAQALREQLAAPAQAVEEAPQLKGPIPAQPKELLGR